MKSKQIVVVICSLSLTMLCGVFLAPVHAGNSDNDIRMLAAQYKHPISGQGIVSRSPDGKYVTFWASDSLNRYPTPGRSIRLEGRRVDYVRWNVGSTKLLVGSASGNNGSGWAWLIDSRRFFVLRKLVGNIATAWFDKSRISYIQATERGPIYVARRRGWLLPRSSVIVASTENGEFLLARTYLHHDRGYRGNLVIYRNTDGKARFLTVVQRNTEFPDEPSELMASNHAGDFVVTLCGNQSHVESLCSAYFVGAKEHNPVPLRDKIKSTLYFDLNVYWSRSGFSGICHTTNDQYAGGSHDKKYVYRLNQGRMYLQKIPDSVIAYSSDEIGHEVYLLERFGNVFLRIKQVRYGRADLEWILTMKADEVIP